uniref:Phosphatidylinositol transfer protein N-terminal domain-containing protein n=1 Tax=Myripristis murdjan TaxID=586833 RepID=A0A667Z025_9TELE
MKVWLETVNYRIGQLYTISKHSHQESQIGEGVEVLVNEPHYDSIHGQGQHTEKRVHLSSKLPSWAKAVVPHIFYITEKSWNYYPYTITGKHFIELYMTNICCSFFPKFSIHIETKYEDNCGENDSLFTEEKANREVEVDFVDIAYDPFPDRHYNSSEDLRSFSSVRTGRGPLVEDWRQTTKPIMCSYKLVRVHFEVWGLQTRVEQFVHKVIRDILLVGHRQAFAWVDEWYIQDTVDSFDSHSAVHCQVLNGHSVSSFLFIFLSFFLSFFFFTVTCTLNVHFIRSTGTI